MIRTVSSINIPSDIKKIAVIAGSGWLPRHVYDSCVQNDIECQIIAIENNFSSELFTNVEYHCFQMHMISKIVAKIKSSGIQHVVFAGDLKKFSIAKLLLDTKGAKLLAMIMRVGINYHAILDTLISFFEVEGLTIIPSAKMVASALIRSGFITQVKPDAESMQDIKKGTEILRAVAHFDVGQALVIQNGLVLGVEPFEAIEDLIERCGSTQQSAGEKCIMIKICKTGQDQKMDLYCVDSETIKNLHCRNFRGIAIEANAAMILDREATITEADKLGLFIYGI